MLQQLKNDGFGRMTSYSRRGPICCTEYRPNKGYFWSHINSDKWHGPFTSRNEAKADEENKGK